MVVFRFWVPGMSVLSRTILLVPLLVLSCLCSVLLLSSVNFNEPI